MTMRIAIEGCLHGELDIVYNTIKFIEQQHQTKVDLLLICGDFQAVRNEADLKCLACPPKYRAMQQFWKYYKGQKKAPIMTIVIGGNHEASNHMQEIPYGGWLAENIYYLGYAGVVEYGGVRIGGVSGIFKQHDFKKGHFERPPYSEDTIRSAYHTRNVDIFRMKQLKLPLDIVMSHDWPAGIHNFGDLPALLKRKPHFREQTEPGARSVLGSPAHADLLYHLRPKYWFAAHLHVKWMAVVDHDKLNENNDFEVEENLNQNRFTRFLSLDKALPQRDFLQVVDVPTRAYSPYEFKYDAEWLAVLRNTNDLMSLTAYNTRMPVKGIDTDYDRSATQEDIEIIRADMDFTLEIPRNFNITVDLYNPKEHWKMRPVELFRNPQNTELCQKLRLVDPFTVFKEGRDPTKPMDEPEGPNIWNDPSEIQLDDNIEKENDPNEIALDDDEEEDDCCGTRTTKPEDPNEGQGMSVIKTTESKEEFAEEKEPESDSDSEDDGAPQARPFIIPFSLPPPSRKTVDEIQTDKVMSPTETKLKEDIPMESTNPPVKKAQLSSKGLKRRNLAIYQTEDDED